MMPNDTIAELAGVAEGSPLAAARATRPEFVGGQAACRDAVLVPVHDTGLGHPLRAALAARMALRLVADGVTVPEAAAIFGWANRLMHTLGHSTPS